MRSGSRGLGGGSPRRRYAWELDCFVLRPPAPKRLTAPGGEEPNLGSGHSQKLSANRALTTERPGGPPPGRANSGVKFGKYQMPRYSVLSGGSAPAVADGAASGRDPSGDPVPIDDHTGWVVTRNVYSNGIQRRGLHLRY